jgi:hypothetical protein
MKHLMDPCNYMNKMERSTYMRTLKAILLATLTSGVVSLLGSLPANAAVLSVGPANGIAGGFVCADVFEGKIAIGTRVDAFDCHAGPNQQFEFNGYTIYTLGGQRCLDIFGGGTVPGTPVDSYKCTGEPNQAWEYIGGAIYNPASGLCLDATTMANSTQLIINTCADEPSQTWQIK